MTENDADKLKLIFDPRTIGDLGVKMYTRLAHALSEAITNSYDADAENVEIKIEQTKNKIERIEIIDDGIGMSFEELQKNFLVVGRKRRKDGQQDKTAKGRFVTGRKGLGKLAMFGIANIVGVITVKDGKRNHFQMDWNKIETATTRDEYFADISEKDTNTKEKDGTIVYLEGIKRKTKIDVNKLAIDLSRRFEYGNGFDVRITENTGTPVNITSDLKFEDIDIEFEFELNQVDLEGKCAKFKDKIKGVIKTARKPLPKELQGISLFARKKLVQESTSFESSSSHFYRYAYGILDIDFIEDYEEDLVATNRRSLDWDNEKLTDLKECLVSILNKKNREWREKRKKKFREEISKKVDFNYVEYISTIPEDKKEAVERIVVSFTEDVENELESIETLLELIPEHPKYHWRYLHADLQNSSDMYLHADLQNSSDVYKAYKNKNFVSAVKYAWEVFEWKLRNVSESKLSGAALINKELSANNSFDKEKLEEFIKVLDSDTQKNIKDFRFLLANVVCKAGNITRHNELKEKREDVDFENTVFSGQQCLDVLSMISYSLDLLDKYRNSE